MAKKISPIIREALDRIALLRTDHRDYVYSHYLKAEEETRGAMLNERGRAAGIDTFALFTHNSTFLKAYASEELIEWMNENPRLSFADYERQMVEGF